MTQPWISHSQPGKQLLLAWGCGIVGGLLLYGSYPVSTANSKAAFFSGLLSLGLGVWGVLTVGRQTIVIDPQKRRITVTDETRLGRKERVIRFDDITQVGISYLGKRSSFVQWYSLSLLLRSGKRYTLFAPGRFYEGSCNEATVDAWRDRLERYLSGKISSSPFK